MWQMIKSYDPATQFYTPVVWAGIRGCEGECRPKNLALIDSSHAAVINIALRDSSDWTILFRRCSDLLVDGLVIRGSQHWGNNDGLDSEFAVMTAASFLPPPSTEALLVEPAVTMTLPAAHRGRISPTLNLCLPLPAS